MTGAVHAATSLRAARRAGAGRHAAACASPVAAARRAAAGRAGRAGLAGGDRRGAARCVATRDSRCRCRRWPTCWRGWCRRTARCCRAPCA
ncbi:MAG: hypothetical protein MZW92_57405 [Comamonadaceae bacterium]|nr:hypothetical protein [Comamonadaceae bacterium]